MSRSAKRATAAETKGDAPSPARRQPQQQQPPKQHSEDDEPAPELPEKFPLHTHAETHLSWLIALTTYFSYALLVALGHLYDFVRRWGNRILCRRGMNDVIAGKAPLLKDWESFFTRNLYHRLSDCWNRPIVGPPRARVTNVVDRKATGKLGVWEPVGEPIPCLNLGSYNYLGFADDWATSCRDEVEATLDNLPVSHCSSRLDSGNSVETEELERLCAQFVGKEDCIVFNMGYLTNATTIPALIGQGGLVISDSMNHTSIVNGCRASGAKVRVFKHNDAASLENVLRDAVAYGQPRTRRPWKKIFVMVEGIYSMEGDICNLPAIVAVCKKYKAYLYLDEAHSIGCMGKSGRGICDHHNVNPADVDVLMGTFTKSFGAMGGYIAGSKELINYLRNHTAGALYGNAMSPVVVAQTLRSLKVIMGLDGTDTGARKLAAIKRNANYFRSKLMEMGLSVIGDWDSPVIPVMVYHPGKLAFLSKECLKAGVAVVIVGFPATALVTSRARFCISAAHTKGDLDRALAVIDRVATKLLIKYAHNSFGLGAAITTNPVF